VRVPPQADALRPFLVSGAVVGGTNEGLFISIVMRRDDETLPVSAGSVHALLAGSLAQNRAGTAGAATGDPPNGAASLWPVARLHPSGYARPPGDGLVLRAAAVYGLPPGAHCAIEPRHRRELLAAVGGGWEQPGDAWQSSANAVLARPGGGSDRLTLNVDGSSPTLLLFADAVLPVVPGGASLDDVARGWSVLLQRVADGRRAVRSLSRGAAAGRSVELHLQGPPGIPLSAAVDVSCLGEGGDRAAAIAATAWPWTWATSDAPLALALEALRRAALDWGFVDPDPALRTLGWQPG
jgi:hypothetical protein